MPVKKKSSHFGRTTALALLILVIASCGAGFGYTWFKSLKQDVLLKNLPDKTFPCVVIGGGVGGLSSSVYLSQLGCKTLLLRGDSPGGALAKTKSVQNWPGEVDIPGKDLVEKLEHHAKHFGTVMADRSAESVDFSRWPFTITLAGKGKAADRTVHALSCIVATGSTPNMLSVPGEEDFWGQGVTNCAICDGPLFKDQTVAVVGGGDSALTEVELLTPLAKKIYMIVRSDSLRGRGSRAHKARKNEKVEILYSTQITKILGDGKGVSGVMAKTKDGSSIRIPLSGIFLAIGSKPNTDMFKDQLSLDHYGLIKLSRDQQSSVDGVFAVGDVCDGKYRQAISAAGHGCVAALQALKFLSDKRVVLKDFCDGQTDSSQDKDKQHSKKAPKNVEPSLDEQVLELDSDVDDQDAEDEAAKNSAHAVIEVETVNELERAVENKKQPYILDCYATWCMPCQLMQPIFEELSVQFKDKVVFLKADADKSPGIIKSLGVRGVPTFIFFDKDGKQVDRTSGQMDKQDLADMLEKLAE